MSDPIFDELKITCPRCHDAIRVQVPRRLSRETAGEVLERQAQDQRIRDLEREVERLNGETAEWEGAAAANERWRQSTAKKWHEMEADRADAERFRWMMANRDAHGIWEGMRWGCSDDNTRSAIDADRAKEGK